jgi:hypothetical protein
MKFYEHLKLQDLGACWFILQLIFVAINVWAAAGVPDSGLAGVIILIDSISSQTASAYLKVTNVISAILWVLSCLAQLFITSKAFVLYKSMGGITESRPQTA